MIQDQINTLFMPAIFKMADVAEGEMREEFAWNNRKHDAFDKWTFTLSKTDGYMEMDKRIKVFDSFVFI